jgi:hypothetical protein
MCTSIVHMVIDNCMDVTVGAALLRCSLADKTSMQKEDTRVTAGVFSIILNYPVDVRKARFGFSVYCHVVT